MAPSNRTPTTVTPYLVVSDAQAAIDFYCSAFKAEVVTRQCTPDGAKVVHAALRIGDGMVLLCDEFPEVGGKSPITLGDTPVTVQLQVPNADLAFQQAVAAGAQVTMPLMDAFWGDRYGQLRDPFGHKWAIFAPVQPQRDGRGAPEH